MRPVWHLLFDRAFPAVPRIRCSIYAEIRDLLLALDPLSKIQAVAIVSLSCAVA